MRCYRDLLVWQRAMALIVATYRLAARLPPEERFELSSQLRRAAISVAANIAEGHGRASTREYLWFLSVATGSLMELETLVLAAQHLGLAPAAEAERLLGSTAEVSKMLAGLRRGLRRRVACVGSTRRHPSSPPNP